MACCNGTGKRLWVERLPPYCPELTRWEIPLGLLKVRPVVQLRARRRPRTVGAGSPSPREQCMNQTLLAGFFHASGPSFTRTYFPDGQ